MKYNRALVVGTVRNASNYIVPDLLRIVNALEEILPTNAFVIESDSSDDTLNKLQNLSDQDSRIFYKSMGILDNIFPNRIQRLRHCRNEYVKAIRNEPRFKDFDLVVVADLDGVNKTINAAKFRLALECELPWDALAANQSARYYDILALRHPLWSPNDWMAEVDFLESFLGKSSAMRHSLTDRMLKIPSECQPISVDSAFGGLCIYRRWVFERCDYTLNTFEQFEECEHVSFHRKLVREGGKILIHPGLVNAHWTSHSIRAIPFFRFLNSIVQRMPFKGIISMLKRQLKDS